MSPFSARFKNINGDDTYPLDEIIYRSKIDNSLLEVEHDRNALASKSPEEWKALFASRRQSFNPVNTSGVWSKRELVLPEIAEKDIITLEEGFTFLIESKTLAKEIGLKKLYMKLSGNSHTGSFKDLGMTVLVSQVHSMIQKGAPIQAVACASTGDTSAALAAYCAKAGIPSIVFLPAGKISTAQLIQPISNGSIVLALDTDFDGCMKIVQEVTADNSIYLANSMNSLRVEGQKTISLEICQQLNYQVPDTIIIPGGNLGNVSALAKGFDDCLAIGLIQKKPRIIVAQTQAAAPFYQAFQRGFNQLEPLQAQKTLASAIQIGNPVSYPKAVRAIQDYNGLVVAVSEEELSNAAHRADRFGFYTCPHTGVALAALEKLVESGDIDKEEEVAIISTAHGLKFTEFKVAYHEKSLKEIHSSFANSVFYTPPQIDSVMDILQKEMKARQH